MRRPATLTLESLDPRVVPDGAGSFDPSFGAGGIANLAGNPLRAVALQTDGKVVVAGAANGDFLVARLNADGSLDSTFGAGGRRLVNFGGTDAARGVAVQPDGKIVVVGSTDAGGTSDIAIARLNADGTDDATFNAGTARRVVNLGGADSGNAVALQSNGAIVVAGVGGTDPDFAAVRLDSTGALDATFNGSGTRLIGFGGTDAAKAVAIQADGRIVLAGSTGADIGVVRLSSAGGLDATFGAGGLRTLDAGGTDSANGVALQSDGKIVLGGTNGTQLIAYRLLADGSPDATFGAGGRAGVSPTGAGDGANAVAVQPDGKVVLVGVTGTPNVAVVRLDTAGAPDGSFGSGGIATFNIAGGNTGTAVALTPAGKIVVAAAAGADGAVLQLLGAATTGPTLVVSGPQSGQAQLYTADPATGLLGSAPSANLGPFQGIGIASLRTASADVDGDGIPDTVLVTGPGVPIRVAVVSGATDQLLVQPFDPFGGDFTGGGFVAAADMTGDGHAEFAVSPDQGGGPRVTVYSVSGGSAVVRANFFGIDDPDFRGGARPALGDVNHDGVADVVVAAGFGGGPRVAIFSGPTVLAGAPARLVGDFFAFPGTDAVNLRNGVFVAAGDVTGDGFADLVFGGGPGGAPRVLILSGALVSSGAVEAAQGSPVANFFVAGNSADRGGVRVAVKNLDGDAKMDVAVGSGEFSAARVRSYLGKNFTGGGEPSTFQDLTPFGGTFLTDGVYVG